jgi:hypothetical protein
MTLTATYTGRMGECHCFEVDGCELVIFEPENKDYELMIEGNVYTIKIN